jgi:sugar phosphate isomerase/epimerase
MKLGVAGLLGRGEPEEIAAVRNLGFGAASWHVPDWELMGSEPCLRRVRDHLHQEGLELCQLLPPAHASLVDPDPGRRQEGITALRRTLDAAAVLGAGNVYVRPGSLNAKGAWTPHPENHRPDTRERLIESLSELVVAAEAIGIPLAVEAHVVSPLHSVSVTQEVFDRVGSAWLCFNADPVNLISSLDAAYETSPLIHQLFDSLGQVVITGHAKDVRVGDELVLHIEECTPGQGFLDHEVFLQRFEECCPRGVVLIEHLPIDRVPEARRALLEFAHRAGVTIEAE